MESKPRPFAHGTTSIAVATRDGRSLRVRHITREDDDLLVELYQRLTPATRRLRFLIEHHDVPDELVWREAHRLSDLNPHLAAALIAVTREESVEQAVAVARLARDADDPTTAELAIVIRDDYQREGLGTIMLDLLIQLAMVGGIKRLRAISLAENEGLHRLINATGLPVVGHTIRGETTQIITIG